MKQSTSVVALAYALLAGTASADVPWYKSVQHTSGTIVSVDPPAAAEAHSLVGTTADAEVKFAIGEAATHVGHWVCPHE